jgi:hypothetical protein
MIAHTEAKGNSIPANESFGLVVDELAEAVGSTEGNSRDETANIAFLWEYDIGLDRWQRISQIVSNPMKKRMNMYR